MLMNYWFHKKLDMYVIGEKRSEIEMEDYEGDSNGKTSQCQLKHPPKLAKRISILK
jgi:hypothetical protein